MSDNSVKEIVRRPRRCISEIELPNGETLVLRQDFARDVIGVCDRSVIRLNLPTTYIGGKAYVARNESLKIVAEQLQRKNQPPKRRRA